MPYCPICKTNDCKRHTIFLGKTTSKLNIEGSSPPEIFIGRYNYPNVYTGLLSPEQYGDTSQLSSPELWHKQNLPIHKIIQLRNQLIYGRTKSHIKKPQTKFLALLGEIAMTHKSISTELKLKKPIKPHDEKDNRSPIIANAAPLQSAQLQENPKIKKKIDYLVNDNHVKSSIAIQELYNYQIPNSQITKILSAGLLGLKQNRRLVPTRWSISCVDSILSQNKIDKIKHHSQIDTFMVFTAEYLGNHYEILLIPRFWSFEVIERSIKGWGVWKDYETIFKRKTYAKNVTGGYYSARLPTAEYLDQIKKQASALILREIRPEYYAPLGVGILRETTRAAFKQEPKTFNTLQEALNNIKQRLRIPIQYYLNESQLIKDLKQTTLKQFI